MKMFSIPAEIENVLEYPSDFTVPVIKEAATVKQKVLYADWIRQLATSGRQDLGVKLWRKNSSKG